MTCYAGLPKLGEKPDYVSKLDEKNFQEELTRHERRTYRQLDKSDARASRAAIDAAQLGAGSQ